MLTRNYETKPEYGEDIEITLLYACKALGSLPTAKPSRLSNGKDSDSISSISSSGGFGLGNDGTRFRRAFPPRLHPSAAPSKSFFLLFQRESVKVEHADNLTRRPQSIHMFEELY